VDKNSLYEPPWPESWGEDGSDPVFPLDPAAQPAEAGEIRLAMPPGADAGARTGTATPPVDGEGQRHPVLAAVPDAGTDSEVATGPEAEPAPQDPRQPPQAAPSAGSGCRTATAYPPVSPPLAAVLRLAERVARLPHADVRVPARVRRVAGLAAERGWGEDTAAAMAWGQADWHALLRYLGATTNLQGDVLRRLTADELLDLLEHPLPMQRAA
jgi:hypothetical protein